MLILENLLNSLIVAHIQILWTELFVLHVMLASFVGNLLMNLGECLKLNASLLKCRNTAVVLNLTLFNLFRSEHERHSPKCPFVRGECTENVPLSGCYLSSFHLLWRMSI